MPPPVALVTGSSRGLGRGIAEALAADGWSVAIHYAANQSAARETAEACRALATSPEQSFPIIGGDLADPAQRSSILPQILQTFDSLHALINNAGIAPKIRADITEATEDSFDQLIATNLKGPYFLTQAVANWMLAHPAAPGSPPRSIIFITSISANTASVSRGDYCLSKAALAMAAQLWAARLASHHINVYEVRPGIMKTDMTAAVTEKYDTLIANGLVPQNRWGTPDDVGRAIRSLIRGDWPFSTGAVFHVDGALTLRRL